MITVSKTGAFACVSLVFVLVPHLVRNLQRNAACVCSKEPESSGPTGGPSRGQSGGPSRGQSGGQPSAQPGGGKIHRTSSGASQPASSAPASPLPFSDSDSSSSDSGSGPPSRPGGSVTPKHSTAASPAAQGSDPRPTPAGAAERPAGDAPAGRPPSVGERDASTWNDRHILHCTYTVGRVEHGRPLVTMAWADAHGELLHQITERGPATSGGEAAGGTRQESMSLAWWCADRLVEASCDLVMRPGAAPVEHVCVSLVLAEDCEQWVWMHVPQLLAARLRSSSDLARNLKRLSVLNVAIDDPILIHHQQVCFACSQVSSCCHHA